MSEFMYNDSELQMDTFLILCLEDIDDITNTDCNIDTRVFIGWCGGTNNFIVRGKRTDIGDKEFVPYAFHCNTANALYTFLEFTLGEKANINMTLYNYNNIYSLLNGDDTTNLLTYDFFETNMHKHYEVSGYDMATLNRKYVIRILNMLKELSSW